MGERFLSVTHGTLRDSSGYRGADEGWRETLGDTVNGTVHSITIKTDESFKMLDQHCIIASLSIRGIVKLAEQSGVFQIALRAS